MLVLYSLSRFDVVRPARVGERAVEFDVDEFLSSSYAFSLEHSNISPNPLVFAFIESS